MTGQVPAWFAPMYIDKVIHKFQSRGFLLKGTTTEATEIKANDVKWRLADAVKAILYKRGNRAVPAGGGRSTVTATMDTYQVYDEVYDDDLEKLPMSEMEIVTMSGAKALGREFDLQIGAAIDAEAIAPTVTDVANGFTLGNAMTLCKVLQEQTDGLWDGDYYCPLPPIFWNQLLGYKQFNSSDWIGGDLPFTKVTDRRSWNGVNWFLGPLSWFTVPALNQLDLRIWHKSAVGYASNYAIKNDIAWENSLTAWTANMRMAGKSKVLVKEGVTTGRFNSNIVITPN